MALELGLSFLGYFPRSFPGFPSSPDFPFDLIFELEPSKLPKGLDFLSRPTMWIDMLHEISMTCIYM